MSTGIKRKKDAPTNEQRMVLRLLDTLDGGTGTSNSTAENNPTAVATPNPFLATATSSASRTGLFGGMVGAPPSGPLPTQLPQPAPESSEDCSATMSLASLASISYRSAIARSAAGWDQEQSFVRSAGRSSAMASYQLCKLYANLFASLVPAWTNINHERSGDQGGSDMDTE
ncbi:hypothetical protein HDV00_011172 [Rhizophlyctis rosea]|nr:hypothetical protein HDV00_011172 [Rhizophlyctis rosea]